MIGLRDLRGRINWRTSKEDRYAIVVQDGNFDTRKTVCGHNDVDYYPLYRGMTEAEVRFHIMPLLIHEQSVI